MQSVFTVYHYWYSNDMAAECGYPYPSSTFLPGYLRSNLQRVTRKRLSYLRVVMAQKHDYCLALTEFASSIVRRQTTHGRLRTVSSSGNPYPRVLISRHRQQARHALICQRLAQQTVTTGSLLTLRTTESAYGKTATACLT